MLSPVARPALLVVIASLAACAACEKQPDAARPEDGVGNRTAVPSPDVLPKVHLTAADGTEQTVIVEVVRDDEELARGLMYRRRMDPDAGMLFLMGEERIHTFWMRNTYLSLDMIFIRRDRTVAGIVENTPPLTDDLQHVDEPSFYVLEVNAGWSKAHGVGKDAKVRFENIRGL